MARSRELAELASAYDGGAVSLRNRLINGAMQIPQRGTSFAPTLNSIFYTLDRWAVYALGAAPTVTQGTGDGGRFNRSLDIAGVAGNTTSTVVQRIESLNSSDLNGAPVVVSARVFSSSASSVTVALSAANSPDNFAAVTSVSSSVQALSAGWNTIFVPANLSSGTPANGLQLEILFGALGAGQVRRITGLQLEPGTVGSQFDRRPIGFEVMLAQRYFEKSYSINVAPGTNTVAGKAFVYVNANTAIFTSGGNGCPFKVTKRAPATVTLFSGAGAAGVVDDDNAGVTRAAIADFVSDAGFRVYLLNSMTPSAAVNLTWHWTANSEL